MLDTEFKYYLNNQDKLVQEYNGKYIVIKGEEVIAAFDNEGDAYFNTSKDHEVGTFLIQYCEPGDGSYTRVFHSRVHFA